MEGNRYAVLIGSSKFQDGKLPNLRCPEKDVEDLRRVLESEGQFTAVPLKDVSREKATREIHDVLKNARRDDLVLIYYSGHGKLDREGNLYLATIDTEIDSLEITSISIQDIQRFIRTSPSRKKILILDCCYAGRVADAFLLKGGVEEQLQQLQSEGRGTYILAASTGIQAAKERDGDEYSLFTKHILEGIKDGKADRDDKGEISIGDLYRYSFSQMIDDDSQKPMKWDFDVEGDELVIARTGKIAGETRRTQTKKMLFAFSEADTIPDRILNDALRLVARDKTHFAESELGYKNLLDRLFERRLRIGDFVLQWDALDRKTEDEFRRKENAALYANARGSMDAKEWAVAVATLEQLLAVDPTYADASFLRQQAQKHIRVSQLYTTGLEHHKERRWAEALSDLAKIQSEVSNYKDVTALIEIAKSSLTSEREAAQRQDMVNAVFVEVDSLITDRDLGSASKKLEAILEVVPNHELATQKLNEVRQERLAALYDEGKQRYVSEHYQEAVPFFRQIIEIESNYRDTDTLLKKAEEAERLRREGEEESAWRAKEELERLGRADVERRKAEATALRQAEQVEAKKAKRLRREAEEEAAWRAKEELERLERAAVERRKAEAAALQQAGEVEAERARRNKDARERAEAERRQRLRAEAEAHPRDEKESRWEKIGQRIVDEVELKKRPQAAGRSPRGGASLGKAGEVAEGRKRFVYTKPLVPPTGRTRIKRKWRAALLCLIMGIAFFSFTVFIFVHSNFRSLDVALLYILAIPLAGGLGGLFLIVALGLYFFEGKALCPTCGAELTDLDPTSNDGVLCVGCHSYLEGEGHWLWPTDENRVADNAIFSAQLARNEVLFPNNCCVCGKPEMRRDAISLSGSPLLSITSVAVPHCEDHTNGAVFEEKYGKTYLRFRSHPYWKAFCKTNGIIPGEVS